jgi:hypothetical protein
MKLTEKDLVSLIKEVTLKILNEGNTHIDFASSGKKIPVRDASELCDDIDKNLLADIDAERIRIKNSEIGSDKYFGKTLVWKLFNQYKNSMQNKKTGNTGDGISFFRFLKVIRYSWHGRKLSYYNLDDNYIIGTQQGGIFLCTYICPATTIGAYKLIKDICQYDNVVFAVTGDLGQMLEKLNCPKVDGTIKVPYNGRTVEKEVYGTTLEAAELGVKILNLSTKSKGLHSAFDSSFKNNPMLKQFYDKNPNIASELLNNQTIVKFLAENPNLVEYFINNPNILQSITDDPISGFLNILKSFR